MVEKDVIYESSIKFDGIFLFKDLYKFCYDWLKEETRLDITESKYEEKIIGNAKRIVVEWEGTRKVTDYFKFEVKVKFEIDNLTDVEVQEGGAKVKTNKGAAKIKLKGILIRDYQGKWEKSAFNKFLRAIYEKWVIKARIEQFEDKLFGDMDEFLAQAKAFLTLEGKR